MIKTYNKLTDSLLERKSQINPNAHRTMTNKQLFTLNRP